MIDHEHALKMAKMALLIDPDNRVAAAYLDMRKQLADAIRTLAPAQSGRGEPASPLLPGLERAAGDLKLWIRSITIDDIKHTAPMLVLGSTLLAITGRGTDHEIFIEGSDLHIDHDDLIHLQGGEVFYTTPQVEGWVPSPNRLVEKRNLIFIRTVPASPLLPGLERAAEMRFICKAQKCADPPQDCDWPICGCDPYADNVLAAFDELKELDAKKEADGYWFNWIPVSEKLPKVGSWVIGFDASKHTVLHVNHFAVGDFRVSSAAHQHGWMGIHITHWVPMPGTQAAEISRLKGKGRGS